MLFFNFFAIFLEFSITLWVGTKQNENIYFLCFSAFSKPILAFNEALLASFNFLNFFAIFLELYIIRQEGTKRNDNLYFPSFFAFSKLFWLEMMP